MTFERAFQAVIFDVDSTLVDSWRSIEKAWTRWAEEFGLTADDFHGMHGRSSESIVAELVPDRVEEATARVNALEEVEVDDCRALPGAAAALATIPPDRCALATSGTRAVATARLAAAGLTPPPVVVTADDVDHAKPDPEIFLSAAAWLGVDPRECLVVEDAPAGIQAARAAGCATLGLRTTVADLAADVVVDDLAGVQFIPGPDGVSVVVLGGSGS